MVRVGPRILGFRRVRGDEHGVFIEFNPIVAALLTI